MFFAKQDTKATEVRPNFLKKILKPVGEAAKDSFAEAFKAENKSASKSA